MQKLLEEITSCSDTDTLVVSLCTKITESITNKKITTEEYKILCAAYFNKGTELGLYIQNNYNKHLSYQFKQNLYELENIFKSVNGT